MLRKILFGISLVYIAFCVLVFVAFCIKGEYLYGALSLMGFGTVYVGASLMTLALSESFDKKTK